MARYEEFTAAAFNREPHFITINKLFEELPLRLRQAIADELGPPSGPAMIPSMGMGAPTEYVDFYRREYVPDGTAWRRCPPDKCLSPDSQGIYGFTIGFWAEPAPGLQGLSLYLTITIEESAEIAIEKMDGRIKIDFQKPTGYGEAARTVVDRLIGLLTQPPKFRGARAPLGFDVSSNPDNKSTQKT